MNAILRHHQAILREFDGSQPLALFLKAYFRRFPILGSRDRRALSALSHAWFRFRPIFENPDIPQLGAAAAYLSMELDGMLQRIFPDFTEIPLHPEREARMLELERLGMPIRREKRWEHYPSFSEGIAPIEYAIAMEQAASVFIRLPERRAEALQNELDKSGIRTERTDVPGAWKVSSQAALNAWTDKGRFYVQDLSSQRVLEILPDLKPKRIWDVCSGAGGKSLLLQERYPNANHWASDVRPQILESLSRRFYMLGRPIPQCVVWDGTTSALPQGIAPQSMDVVLCDVPCSGSGTWRRNPEQAFAFTVKNLEGIPEKQLQILTRASDAVLPSGCLIYLTCSVFADENEAVCQRFISQAPFTLQAHGFLNCWNAGGDVLFYSVLRRNATSD